MKDSHARPICHRAEDLVSYLFGEASTADALDFRNHLQRCEACRSEFAVFNQVHDSIQLWRNEALGVSFNPAEVSYDSTADSYQFAPNERKLSARAALREFFSLSPLWLRGATAFAAVLLCVLGVLVIARLARRPVEVTRNNDVKLYTEQELKHQVDEAVNRTRAELTNRQNDSTLNVNIKESPRHNFKRPQLATHQPKNLQPRSLNREERVQLAVDLRVTLPADEEESLLALPERDIPQ